MPVCAYEHCDHTFPVRGPKRFCSTQCRTNDRMNIKQPGSRTYTPRRAIQPGDVFGRLTVVERHEKRAHRWRWLCECSCGGHVVEATDDLNAGRVTSCGCDRERSVDRPSRVAVSVLDDRLSIALYRDGDYTRTRLVTLDREQARKLARDLTEINQI